MLANHEQQGISSSSMPPNNPMMNNGGNTVPAPGAFIGHPISNGTIDPQELAIQQMHALEPLGWRGGEKYWDGPHDDFCFVCGSSKELFGCQTCSNCYHADCMTPSLDPNEVPTFWFCPHCVEGEFHIPPPEEHSFASLPSSLLMDTSSRTPSTNPDPPTNTLHMAKAGVYGLEKIQERSNVYPQRKKGPLSVTQQPTPPSNEPTVLPKSRPRPDDKPHTSTRKVGRPRRTSPPRKKSKYSAFSKEVDKALTVIYSELETAAGYGRSEGGLESKVQALEQQLRMQEGQMLLTARESEFARKELVKEREEFAATKVDNAQLMDENMRLREDIQRKEAELKDWRLRLRSMIGSEFE